MRLLELFSGTGSVGKVVTEAGWEVVSVDICDKYMTPTHKANILEWDHRIYPADHFDVVWASPPCTEYSRLKHNTGLTTNMEEADRIVKRALEIIAYFRPPRWYIENPETGLLKTRDFMVHYPFINFDYCAFSNWGYKKRTRIWTNVMLEPRLCAKTGRCPNMIGKFHRVCFGGQGRPKEHVYETCPAGATAYRIPPDLIKYLFNL
jgi:site-specific DNA-cytosine methylase